MKKPFTRNRFAVASTTLIFSSTFLLLSSCSGGGGSDSSTGSSDGRASGLAAANFDCDGNCSNQQLSTADVERILAQGVAAAEALGRPGTLAVVDRVGNVLAVYQMPGAPSTTTFAGDQAGDGLEQAVVPATLAAISKAGTGAYLSSQGNAFSTRTASQIVQENFNVKERFAPGGPLFGVQFSQLLCGDVTVINPSFTLGLPLGSKPQSSGLTGPRPLPLGLSADTGGIPLYKSGDLVGGIGFEGDGDYSFDDFIEDVENDDEERVVLSASVGFEAPSERTADRVYVAGRALRYSDLSYSDIPNPAPLGSLSPSGFVAVAAFTDGQIRAGSVFGTAESGVKRTTRAGITAMTLVDGAGNERFPSRSGTSLGGAELQAFEVEALLDSALLTANRSRAAIRNPLDTPVRVSVWVIDSAGNPLGFTRSDDAPVFGIDVSLQKARAANFFSSNDAGSRLSLAGFGSYVSALGQFVFQDVLNGTVAFANRSIGNLARPFFPDGINGNRNGPFSFPHPTVATPGEKTWSPFNTGIQLDLIAARATAPLQASPSLPDSCTDTNAFGNKMRNGIQIFPGSVPLYRGTVLIGAIGISGDGIDQDDMTAFFGASRRGLDFAGHPGVGDADLGFNAPREMRADQLPLTLGDTRLRYVNCPEGPFSGDNGQNVCDGL